MNSCSQNTERAEELFGCFAGSASSYDEAFAGPGELRRVWARFAAAAKHLSAEEFGHRWQQAQRMLRQNSLAYPEPGDPAARRHPWALDAFPLAISADEWRTVENGLEQRARLLDLVLHDLYGPQRLLREGVLPPEVVFRHPGFLLPYHGCIPPGGHWLHLYAADLARSPDGRWWVLNDRTEAPSGAGFALENRIAMSRMLPGIIHACQVERLAPFFLRIKQLLTQLLPVEHEQPRVVLVSRAAGNANYFEDAFLARYLGYTLAEAEDLDVRGDKVYLKTLGGLKRVHVLWRRPNSEDCDPLELSTHTPIGVAGLLQAIRSANVAVVNNLGSGLVESPVLMAFLPQLSVKLLGEPLLMPSVATWWCGDPVARQFITSHIDQLEVRPAYRRRGAGEAEAVRLAQMSKKQLLELIETDPGAFIAREFVNRSNAPVWSEGGHERAYVALRAFAVSNGDSYQLMPGGLVRIAKTAQPLELTLLAGEGSKDAWVLADRPVAPVTLLEHAEAPVAIRRGGVELPSRAAEHFFWLGRHTSRGEVLARIVRATALRLGSEESAAELPEMPDLLRVLAELGQIEPGVVVEEIRSMLPAVEQLLPPAVFDNQEIGALRAIVSRIAVSAASVRDLISIDNWKNLRHMNDTFWRSQESDPLLDVLEKVDGLIVQLAAFSGHVAEGMTRTHAWRFLDFGRRLEHALQTAMLIRSMCGNRTSADHATFEAILEICDALMTYRSRYGSRMQLAPVLDLLVTDETNPRSILFHTQQCVRHVEELPHERGDTGPRQELEIVTSLVTALRTTDVQQVSRFWSAGDSGPLATLLGTIQQTLPQLSDELSHRYFFHSGPTLQLGAEGN